MSRNGRWSRFGPVVRQGIYCLWLAALALPGLTNTLAYAAENRITTVVYNDASQAKPIKLQAKRGFATVIEFEPKEYVISFNGHEAAGSGDSDGWIVDALAGQRLVFLKPKVSAQDTNLLIVTNKYSYVFDLRVLSDKSQESGVWRMAIVHPVAANEDTTRLVQSDPAKRPRNKKYSMQAQNGDEDFIPIAASDNGEFTYITIPEGHDVPAVFRVTDGQESMVNFHMEGYTVVIHEVAKQFVLRFGKQVVSVWNDDYARRIKPPSADDNRLLIGNNAVAGS